MCTHSIVNEIDFLYVGCAFSHFQYYELFDQYNYAMYHIMIIQYLTIK